MTRVRKQNNKDNTSGCPIKYLLGIFGGKWKLPIICALANGVPQRYSTIQRKLGNITNVMLSQSLHELEAAGMVHRKQYNEVPPHVEYTLTERGKSILPSLTQAAAWAVEDMKRASLASCCGQCAEMD